ncbi:MAG: TrkH family potassium uptake protein [Ostreibacterium sp.]
MAFIKRINYAVIIKISGVLLLFNALFMLLCVPVSLYYHEPTYLGLLTAGLLTATVGGLAYTLTHKANPDIGRREGYLIVTFVWILMAIFGSLPYLFSVPQLGEGAQAVNHLNVTNAFFETMSGFTTTGASILDNIEIMPKGLLFWRSLTHWIGGMGIIVLAIAILPLLGIGGMQLFVAEAPGISADKLHPRITDTAKRLWLIYVALTLAETVLLKMAGMGWFDAVNQSMSTLSTGGFSTKNASMAYWQHQPLIQYIVIVFMILAGTSFVLNYYLIKRQFRKVFSNQEFILYLSFIGVFTLIFAAVIDIDKALLPTLSGTFSRLEFSLREALFTVVSIITTTGFVTVDFARFTPFISMMFFVLMFVGGCAGSTAGGIKVVRHLILFKHARNEFRRQLNPSVVIPVQYNHKSVPPKIVYNVLAFFMVYIMVFMLGAMIMSWLDKSNSPSPTAFSSALSVTATTLGNVGPAFANYSPTHNFSAMSDAGKWFSTLLMLLGRLELFTVLILLTPDFWRR